MINKKVLFSCAVATALCVLAPTSVKAEESGWRQDSNGYWYEFSDGGYAKSQSFWDDSKLYHFDENGYMICDGWYEEKSDYEGLSRWYYANPDGTLVTGWKQIDGDWYYFNSYSGSMVRGRNYIYDEKTGESKYYTFGDSGKMIAGWVLDTYTDGSGTLRANWYYANGDGTAYAVDGSEWLQDGDDWYYISTSGKAARHERICVYDDTEGDGTYYYFDKNCKMVTGWYQNGANDSDWVYADADGTLRDGWLEYNGDWYWFDDGYMKTDTKVSDKNDEDIKYYVGSDGKMITGWYSKHYFNRYSEYTQWYYAYENGVLYDGWLEYGGKWYFIDEGLALQDECTNTPWYDKAPSYEDYYNDEGYVDWDAYHKAYNAYKKANPYCCYIFDENGAMVVGWYSITTSDGTSWFYADADGKGHDGWLEYEGKYYYIEDGRMLRNTVTPDGFIVDKDGVCQ